MSMRRPKATEIEWHIERAQAHPDELWFCGGCNHGQNEWLIREMLFDTDNDLLVTPCCHTEAAEVMQRYEKTAYAPSKVGPWE